MFKITSDLETVALRMQRGIQLAETSMELNLRRAGLDASVAITFRIQQQGVGSKNQQLRTKSAKRTGDYSKAYAKKRTERGRQVARVDFTMDGDLLRSFTVLTISPALVTVGFHDDRQADIAGYLEAYFGEAFYATDEEINAIIDGLVDRLLDDLEGK